MLVFLSKSIQNKKNSFWADVGIELKEKWWTGKIKSLWQKYESEAENLRTWVFSFKLLILYDQSTFILNMRWSIEVLEREEAGIQVDGEDGT